MAISKIDLQRDWSLEHKFSRTIKGILGNFFIVQDIDEDMQNGTDFLTFRVEPVRVAVRLRRYCYFREYPEQFTIRYSRPSGVKTELAKIVEGLVDYFLYGFVNQNENQIIQYFIGDLNVFRSVRPEPIAIIPNDPPDSEFAAYSLAQFQDTEFILKFWP